MAKHARLSASESHRWIHCPGSINVCVDLPRVSNAAATLGTGAHALAEKLISQKIWSADMWLGQVLHFNDGGENKMLSVDQEMVDGVNVILKHVKELINSTDVVVQTEQRVSLEFVRPNMFGTADVTIDVGEYTTLHVVDFKYGFTPVWLFDHEDYEVDENLFLIPKLKALFKKRHAEETLVLKANVNSQLLYYAAGALAKEGWLHDDVVITVIQPRAFEVNDVQQVRLTTAQVHEWAMGYLRDRALETEDPNAPLVAGEWCRWCPAQATCETHAKMTESVALIEFANDEAVIPVPTDLEKLKRVLRWTPQLQAWIRMANEYAFEMLNKGLVTSEELGYKLVRKKANRAFGTLEPDGSLTPYDDATAEKRILEEAKKEGLKVKKEDLYTAPELKSPAQLEKIKALKPVVARVAVKPHGELTLAELADPRKEIVQTTGQDFEGVDDVEA